MSLLIEIFTVTLCITGACGLVVLGLLYLTKVAGKQRI